MKRCRCGRFQTNQVVCQLCWSRSVRSLRTRIHAALERAGICDGEKCWWWV